VFGTRDEADLVARQLWAVHEHVTGPDYRANDPELLMWVHATLVDTALRVHARFLRPLNGRDAERYYQDSIVVAAVLGVPRELQPPDLVAFQRYMRDMVGTLRVSDTARELADAVLHPRLPFVAEPGMALARELTAGLLPRPLRQQFGLDWDRNRKAALLLAGAASRTVLPRVPSLVRRVPTTLRA
ncbi:MAG TPA: oxygenase MpaB family protein, partial [Mycobacteriales bacterium]|nr:oxygenase MpaB family protein [Mycobacteriales bacterium]